MKHEPQPQINQWLGLEFSVVQGEALRQFGQWLSSEGIPAGLLSSAERDRIWDRHIADSLSFCVGWIDAPPKRLLDAGSGAGLPGIPLAIAFPHAAVTLLDRSTKRVRLLKRAIRVLGLANVEALVGDVREQRGWESVAMRAVFSPDEAVKVMRQALTPEGRGVLGLAHRRSPDPAWNELGGRVVKVTVLDPPGWLLMIQQCGD